MHLSKQHCCKKEYVSRREKFGLFKIETLIELLHYLLLQTDQEVHDSEFSVVELFGAGT